MPDTTNRAALTHRPACYAQHEAMKSDWAALEQIDGARFMPTEDDAGNACLLECANCAFCRSTLGRLVPLMTVDAAETEALRVWRFKTKMPAALPAAFELRQMARQYFVGEES